MTATANLTPDEIEAIAAAMWDCGIKEDDRPPWRELDPHLDGGLMQEFREQAVAGIERFLEIRAGEIRG